MFIFLWFLLFFGMCVWHVFIKLLTYLFTYLHRELKGSIYVPETRRCAGSRDWWRWWRRWRRRHIAICVTSSRCHLCRSWKQSQAQINIRQDYCITQKNVLQYRHLISYYTDPVIPVLHWWRFSLVITRIRILSLSQNSKTFPELSRIPTYFSGTFL